ncbi:hypothetical protein H2198_004971 [Neophaeococcomyces mojaviensis]|uniref:Uncharacterized protein n=1 Tax=Neophaeococcomyces mojaviensis TaxID=3383035 RepID=A0ACC3A6X4_9EURO|nr:hypothetical protein H2198_004971 [Knufia sp. JES_112]
MSEVKEGHAPFTHTTLTEPAQTWYQIHGSLTATTHPLIILHGGPGASHIYLTDLVYLQTHHNRTIIFYDQIGCGNSTHLPHRRLDTSFWTPQLFIDELDNLISHLNIKSFDLLGQSWGGMLASEYAVTKSSDSSTGLKRIIIANSPASMPLWMKSCNEWRAMLPRSVDETLTKYEAAQDYTNPEYTAAVLEFYKLHLCRKQHPNGTDPFPEPVMKMMKLLEEDDTVYFTMNGPSEFTVIGSLKEWSVIGRLGKVNVPTLVINGEYDEARAICVKPFVDEIKGAEWVTIQDASHCAHLERTEEFCRVVTEWTERH